jgi:hypothetical protein
MDRKRALEIVTALAEGIDPTTGEMVPPSHTLQQPDIIRALHEAAMALRDGFAGHRHDRILPPRAGQPWTDAEDCALVSESEAGLSEKEMSERHQRTQGSIRSRLVRLGKLTFGEPDPDR